jgi:hypothetical protein
MTRENKVRLQGKIIVYALWCIIIALFSVAPSPAASTQSENVSQSGTPNVTQDTQAVFESFKERVVKIEVLEAGSGTKALLGTGFYITREIPGGARRSRRGKARDKDIGNRCGE